MVTLITSLTNTLFEEHVKDSVDQGPEEPFLQMRENVNMEDLSHL